MNHADAAWRPMPPYAEVAPMRTAAVRAVDAYAVERWGYPSIVLMENAGRNAAGVIYSILSAPADARVLVLCGTGNNGGDGLVVARHLRNAGVAVTCVMAAARGAKLSADCETNLTILERLGDRVVWAESGEAEAMDDAFARATAVVDALLGTGSKGSPRGVAARLVERANAMGSRVLRIAIDVPTGLDADSGACHAPTFRADWTITMAAAKAGFANAGRMCGRVVVVDIGAPVHEIPAMRS